MRLFSPHAIIIAILLGGVLWPGGQAEAFSFADIRHAAQTTTQGFRNTAESFGDVAHTTVTGIRSSVDVGQVAVGAALDSRIDASANVFDSLSRTLYCSVTSFLRIDTCDEKVAAPVATTGTDKQGGTATFIVGKAPQVTVQQNPVQPSKTLVVQSSLPAYIAPVERSGMTEAQVAVLIDRRIAAITPVQNVNNYFQTYTTGGGGSSVGYIQGPSGINELRDQVDGIEASVGALNTSQWTTLGSNIYYSTGNVGIGTTTPGSDLTVAGDFDLTGAFQISGSAGTSGYVLQSTGAGTAPAWVATSSLGISGTSQWTTLSSDVHYAGGNVGIGSTSAPTSKLTITGTTGAALLHINSTAGTRLITVSETGNLLIGTSTPTDAKLVVHGRIVLTDGDNTVIAATTTSSGSGNTLSLVGGRSSAGLAGGTLEIGGASATAGGGVNLTGAAGSSFGGAINIVAGAAGSNSGSSAFFSAGNTSNGGNIALSGGSSGTTGGSITLDGGSGSSTRSPIVLQSNSTGNVAIGTSTPLSARFTIVGTAGTQSPFLVSSSTDSISMFAITNTGAISVNNSVGDVGSVLVSNGANSAPTWTATTSLGMSSSQWTTSGSNISFSTGNVGIGTTANSNLRLSIVGDVATDWGSYIGLSGTDTNWRVAGTSTNAMITTSIVTGNRINFVYGSASNEGITFGPSGSTTALELLSTSRAFFRGNVAIGTSTVFDGDALTVHGDIRLTDYNPNNDEVYIKAGTTTSGSGLNLYVQGGSLGNVNGGEIQFRGASSNSGGNLSISGGGGSVENGGNVNISAGSASSGNGGASGSFSGAFSSGGGEINLNGGSTNSGGTRGGAIRINGGSGTCCSAATRGFLLLQESSHGQVGIGTSTPAGTFSIKGSPLLSPIVFSSSSDEVMFTMLKDGSVGIGTAAPARALHVVIATDNAPVRFQDSSGYCEINPTTTTWTCTSDERLKKDIVDLDSAAMLEKLSRVHAVNFRWNNQTDSEVRFGMIAQNVEQYFPEFVTTDEKGYKSVSYGAFTSVLVSAVQELNTRLTTLEESVALAQLQAGQLSGPLHTAVLDTITATLGVFNKVQIEDGVELKDKATGQTYCLTIVMGEWAKTEGACGTNVNINTNTSNSSGDDDTNDDTATTTDPVPSDDDNATTTDPVIDPSDEEDEPEPAPETIDVPEEPTPLPDDAIEPTEPVPTEPAE